MDASKYYFLLQDTVDNAFKTQTIIDTDSISEKFQHHLQTKYTDDEIACILICAGFIPDMYGNDSSEETLFTKLVEVLVCEWARRIGCQCHFVKQKSSYEDVNITLNGKTIVCDAKSFRLGRSQQAPNVKDFLKLEDIRKWLSRYSKKLGGLVTYPDTHEWTRGSDAYQYCSTKDAPTVMLPYKYLALILHFKGKFNVNELDQLWNYNLLFPSPLVKTMPGGNRVAYWKKINSCLIQILHISSKDFNSYIAECDITIQKCVKAYLNRLELQKKDMIDVIRKEVTAEDVKTLRDRLTAYRTEAETLTINNLIKRIKDFRLEKEDD